MENNALTPAELLQHLAHLADGGPELVPNHVYPVDNMDEEDFTPAPLPYFYLGIPEAMLGGNPEEAEAYRLSLAAWAIEPLHIPYIQSQRQPLVLSKWIEYGKKWYEMEKLLDRDHKGTYFKELFVLTDYQNNAFATYNDPLAYGTPPKQPKRFKVFCESFDRMGLPLPLTNHWTLFTGEGQYGNTLWSLCLKNQGVVEGFTVPMQISATWNFNVALEFIGYQGGGWGSAVQEPSLVPLSCGLIALHYTASSEITGLKPIRAHLMQELGQYHRQKGEWSDKACECEVLLQPLLRLRVLRVEELGETLMPVRAIRRVGAVTRMLKQLRILHVQVMPLRLLE